jgi:transcriptional regulator with XRE-family HTH domain
MSNLSIGKAVKRAREFRKLTQYQLADAMNCPRSYVSKIENGRTTPTLATERIAKALDTEGWRLLRWASRQSDELATPEVIA